MRSALTSAPLRRIIAAYAVNRLGTWFGLVALLVAVYDHTHSALAVAGLLFAGQALPALLVPAVVARVETIGRRGQLSGLYVFEAVVTALLVLTVGSFSLPAVLFLVALDGTAALAASALLRAEVARVAREGASEQAAMQDERTRTGADARNGAASASPSEAGLAAQPADAHDDPERAANAALNVAFSTTFVIGPALAGAIVAAAGAPAALLVDVASFLLGAALLVDLRVGTVEGPGSVRARLREAWRYINEVPSLRGLLAAEILALIFIETGGPIEVTYVKSTLHAGDRGLGLLLAAWGVGSILGSIVFARLVKRPLGSLLCFGTLAIGGAYLVLAASGSLALACAAGVLGGIGNGLQWPSLISAVQRLAAEHLHGRLMGGVESLGALCISLGLPLGGLLVAASSPRAAFAIVGAGAVLATFTLARSVRAIPNDAPRPGREPLAGPLPTSSLSAPEATPQPPGG